MKLNEYGRELLQSEIDHNKHREFVGGLWEEVGALQLEFLRKRGLQPSNRLLDVGCGALRGGIHCTRYLDAGGYHGMDINASLIEAGKRELGAAMLAGKNPRLLVDDKFDVSRFDTEFDCAIAVSVFTHLPIDHIIRCLTEVGRVLKPEARFFASYFEAPTDACLQPLTHPPAGIVTGYDADPYHYSLAEMAWMAERAQMQVENVGDWNHPRGQRMLAFRRSR